MAAVLVIGYINSSIKVMMIKMKQQSDQARKTRVLLDGIPLCVLVGGLVAGLLYFAGMLSQNSPIIWFCITWAIATALSSSVWSVLVIKFFQAKQHVEHKITQSNIGGNKDK